MTGIGAVRIRRFVGDASKGVVGVIFCIVVLACLLPFLVMVINATHSNAELSAGLYLLPGNSIVPNYRSMITQTNIWRGFWNSCVISIPVTLGIAYLGSLTGYGFSKFNFRYKNVLFWFILGTLMVPDQASLVGLYQFGRTIGLLDTYWIIILPAIAKPQTVFWVRMYCDSAIPRSLMESARIEGCGELAIFHRIIFPLIKPAVATISIFNFVQIWNNYIIPLVVINSKIKYPLPIHVAILKDVWRSDLGAQYVGIAISVVPIIIVFGFLAKRIIGGLTLGAIKG